ncbi:hypothetical protein FRC01_001742 [Tulasnella sp. 417]|nr:hypothetical protein FRC01_001742 [Tulasnella sp. 417]
MRHWALQTQNVRRLEDFDWYVCIASAAPVRTQGISGKKDRMPGNIDPLDGSDEDGYATPSEVALPESPVVETTSGSDSAVVVNYAGVSRSDTLRSAPPAYEDMDWMKVEVPSGRSSPVKDQTLRSPVSQKKLPEIPPRRKGIFGRTLTSSKTPASSGTSGQGISEGPEGVGKPLMIADPKAGGGTEPFSNQDPLPINYNKKMYPSGEHLYHAMKFMDTRPLLAEHIRECPDPKGEAARFFFERNPGWDQMRVQKMEEVIQLKCKQHSSFKDRLRETGDTHIFFNDPDPFWGTGADGSGQNQFGEALMRVRATVGKGRLTRSLGL